MEETIIPSTESPPSDDGDPMDVVTATQNPNNDHSPSNSGSGSDSESDDEAQALLELQTVETKLSANPANYDAHVQYITALRKQGGIDKLRLAREAMSQLFPLTPATWQQWANDEISLISSSTTIPTIEKLYECGVSDYLSISLWCDYLNFIQKFDSSVRECSPAGISKARNLFERALIACGLMSLKAVSYENCTKATGMRKTRRLPQFWFTVKGKAGPKDSKYVSSSLSIPHRDLKSTLLAYKAWESEHGNTLDVSSSSTDELSPRKNS